MFKPAKIWQSIPLKKKIAPYAVFFILFYIVLFFVIRHFDITREKIEAFIGPFGAFGIAVLVLIQYIAALTPIPDSSLTIMGVLLFGPIYGPLAIFIGMFAAAVTHFFIARRLGKAIILKKYPESEKYFEEFSQSIGITKLVLLRIFAIITFDISSYIAGISTISFKKFCLATVLGLFPIIFTSVLIAVGLFAQNALEIFLIWGFYFIFLLFIRFKSKRNKIARENASPS